MPRQAPGKKPANPHNNRHENGLVGPGKRIVKQKSNGHLNGSPKGGSQSSTPPLPTSTEPALTLGDENNLNGSLKDLKHDVDGDSDGFRSSQCPPSDDTPECYQNGTIHQTSSEVHSPRQPDVNASARDTIYSVNPVRLVSSIAKSCPIQDTIALLIFLLQLPPALLTTTQYLFATLSFMPSSVGAIIQLVDPLSKGSLGAPAITTVLVVSVLTILCMMPLWTPLQNFALDVAQVQIAITLGGGYSNKSGYFDSAFICILVVTAMHLSQSRDVRQFLAENVLSSWVFDFVRPHLPQMFQSLRPFSLIATQHFQHVPPGWVRLIPAGHILSQAALRIVRRWLFKQSMTQLTKTGKSGDTEASAGSNSQDVASESGSMAVPAAHMSDTPASPNKIQEKTERISSTKKRKRQQTLVRSQQPFWAALASIKVTIMREYEHSRTSAPGIGTSRSLLDTETPDILKVMGEEARVWILSVLPTVIKFDVSCSTFEEQEHESKAMRPTPPFYLRVNGAPWTSASIYPTHLGSKPEDDAMQHWVGEVSGLAPNCVYQCSMHRCDNDIEFCVLNLKTPAAPDTEQLLPIVPQPREMLRPDSPTTTMKNSIAAAEVKLNDARARIKRSRNEHKRAHTSLRKETQTLHDRLTGSSGGDEKQRQKALQMSQDKQRAEETCISIDNLLSELDTIPEEELDEWNTHKTTHNTEKNSLLAARNEFNSGRTACKSELQSHQQDLAHAQKAIEKAKKHQTKLKDQTDSIDQAKRLGLSEKERKSNKQNAKDIERRGIEKNYADQFLYLAQGIHSEQIRAQAIWNNIAHVERQQQQAAQAEHAQQAAQQQAQQQARLLSLQQASGPLTPEGNLPGTNPPSSTTRSTFPFPFPSLGPSLGLPSSLDHSVSHVHSQSSQSHSQPSPRLPFISPNSLSASTNARARSSSMRSAYSAYMDFEDADPIPPMPGVTNDENMPFTGPPRNNSAGSGHNSSPGQQNSPINRQLGNGSPGLGMWGK